MGGRLQLDPERNNFPVTLHDPCNMVRSMGIVEPQRRILRKIFPSIPGDGAAWREELLLRGRNGFAITSPKSFIGWKAAVSGRMKLKQTLEAFQDVIGPETHKYVCAPCSNCKGQIRDLFNAYGVWEKCSIFVRRIGRAYRERHDGNRETFHRLGMALTYCHACSAA